MFKRKKIKRKFVSVLIVASVFISVIAAFTTPEIQRFAKSVKFKMQRRAFFPKIAEKSFTLQVPYFRQEHALSCEIAALRMALSYYGVKITEKELVKKLPFDTRLPRSKNNIWGDPNRGFVGDIDGKIPDTGYGVYEKPLARVASEYREAKIITGARLSEILLEVYKNHPVIVWGTLASGKDISWRTPDGRRIQAIFGEHTRVVIGFTGSIENPEKIILHDPIYGTLRMPKKEFLSNWKLLGNKALVVY